MKWATAKPVVVHEKLPAIKWICVFVAEFIGTFILMFVGCGSEISDPRFYGFTPTIDMMKVPLCFGMGALVSIQIVGHISGSHINPVLSYSAVLLGHIPLTLLPVYTVAQLTGGTAGYGTVMLLAPSYAIKSNVTPDGICTPKINPQITLVQGFAMETILSLYLTLFFLGVCDSRNKLNTDTISIRFALAIMGMAVMAGPFTTCNMNPARTFGPGLLNWSWEDHWVWWVSSYLGGTLAALLYRYLLSEEPTPDKAEP